jgi:alcohol dehydrogenase
MQQEHIGIGSIQKLSKILIEEGPKNIFLATGKTSYESSGAKKKIEELIGKYSYIHFFDFAINPSIEDVKKGIELYKKENCDITIAVGGGSVIDIAKSINSLASQEYEPKTYITQKNTIKNKGHKLIAIPTTAGTGSEATHFAVIYIDKTKYSLSHKEFILPDYVILDPSLTLKLPARITAVTGIDALAQAVEAYWSVNSTDESKDYAKKAIPLILSNLSTAVKNPTEASRIAMMKAANFAGKAINIAKTTACHAISYPITSYFGVPHGHAVGLTLSEMVVYNNNITNEDCIDNRGVEYVKNTMKELTRLFGSDDETDIQVVINKLLQNIGLETNMSQVGITSPADFDLIINHGFNPERVKNNPRKLTKLELSRMLTRLK